MNKTLRTISASLALAMIILLPMAPAYAKITPDCGTVTNIRGHIDESGNLVKDDTEPVIQSEIKQCDFNSAMQLINNSIDFLLKDLAAPIAVIALCYAGILLIFSGGSSEKRTKAKHIFFNVIIGFIIALVAWLVVHAILAAIGFKDTDPNMYLHN
jgi:hypothetical protein